MHTPRPAPSKRWEKAAIASVLAAPVLHTDETSIRINGKNHGLHDDSTGDITLMFCHPNRGRAAMNDIGIIPRYGGVLIYDRRSGSPSFVHCLHALCGATSNATSSASSMRNTHRWMQRMLALLNRTARKVGKSPDRTLCRKDVKALRKRDRTILTMGRRELPPVPPRTPHRQAENLLETLARHEDAVLMSARNADVPSTTNRAERDFRMARVKQKISGCLRSPQDAVIGCRIDSDLKSASAQGYNPITAIQIALKGNAVDLIPG